MSCAFIRSRTASLSNNPTSSFSVFNSASCSALPASGGGSNFILSTSFISNVLKGRFITFKCFLVGLPQSCLSMWSVFSTGLFTNSVSLYIAASPPSFAPPDEPESTSLEPALVNNSNALSLFFLWRICCLAIASAIGSLSSPLAGMMSGSFMYFSFNASKGLLAMMPL